MSIEIIDNFNSEKPTIHAAKSFRYFLIESVLLVSFMAMNPADSQDEAILVDLCLLGLLINSILASVHSYKSFYFKEKSLKKYIGGLGSIVIICILFYIIRY